MNLEEAIHSIVHAITRETLNDNPVGIAIQSRDLRKWMTERRQLALDLDRAVSQNPDILTAFQNALNGEGDLSRALEEWGITTGESTEYVKRELSEHRKRAMMRSLNLPLPTHPDPMAPCYWIAIPRADLDAIEARFDAGEIGENEGITLILEAIKRELLSRG